MLTRPFRTIILVGLTGAAVAAAAGCGSATSTVQAPPAGNLAHTVAPSAPPTTTIDASVGATVGTTALPVDGKWWISSITPTGRRSTAVLTRHAYITIQDGQILGFDLVNTYTAKMAYRGGASGAITPAGGTAAGYASGRPADLDLITEALQQVIATPGHITIHHTATTLTMTSRRYDITLTRVTTVSAAPTPVPSASSSGSAPADQAGLDVIAQALDEQGSGAFTASFGGLRVDTGRDLVDLYARSQQADAAIIAAAARAHPGLDMSRVVPLVSQYSKQQLDRAIARLMRDPAVMRCYLLTSAAVAPDASGIQATSSASYAKATTPDDRTRTRAAATALARLAGVPVTLTFQPLTTS